MTLTQFLALAQVLGGLVDTGKTTVAAIRAFLQQEGASDEQLAALDAKLTAAIDQREAEHGA